MVAFGENVPGILASLGLDCPTALVHRLTTYQGFLVARGEVMKRIMKMMRKRLNSNPGPKSNFVSASPRQNPTNEMETSA